MMYERKNILRWLGLFVSFVASSLTGFSTAFNVYALALKETFGYTQTQVEVMPSFGTWGFSLAILQSAITWKFGHNVTYVVIWILSPVSIGLLYIGTVYRDFFHNWPVLIGIFHFLVSVCDSMLQVLVCQISVQNFNKKHVGKIIGAYCASMGSGKIFYAGFFTIFFKNNLGGFFLYTGILWIIVYGLTFLLHRPIADDEETSPMLTESKDPGQKYDSSAPDEDGGSSIKDIIRSPFFHAVFWAAAVFCSIYSSFVNNITSITHSADFNDPVAIVYALAAAMVFGRIFFGSLYDCAKKEIFASLLLIICYSLYIAGLFTALVSFNKPTLFVTTVLAGVSSPACIVIPMSMLVTRFGRRYYGVLHCALMAFFAAFLTLFQIIIGRIYDAEASENQTENWCSGRICFYWSLVMLICVPVLLLIIQLINFFSLLVTSLKPNASVV